LKQNKFKYLATVFFLFVFFANGQNIRVIDSLQALLKNAPQDTTLALLFAGIGEEYFTNEPVKAIEYYSKAIEVAEKKISSSTGLEKDKYYEVLFTANNNIGYIYKLHGNINQAINYYFKSLKVAEETHNNRALSSVAANIGVIYRINGDHEKALEFYKKGLDAAIRGKIPKQEALGYTNIGRYYNTKGDTASAMKYYIKALKINQELNDAGGLGLCYNNIGYLYITNQHYPEALFYLRKALEWKLKEKDDKVDIGMAYNNLAKVHLKMGQVDSALFYYHTAEEKQKDKIYPEYYATTLNGLYNTYKKKGDATKALKYLEDYKIFSDSLFSSSNKESLTKTQLQYDFEKKEAVLKAEQEKKEAVAAEESRKQKIILWSISGILFIVIVFAGLTYRNYRQKQKINLELADKNKLIHSQKEIVEAKQKEILDSILYAEQIQRTLIANHDFVNQTIPDSFVVFKPKDIVSGDFYWATKKESKFFLAVCDSTGHGVPGAFMSLLNISFLNEAINEKNILDPAAIFEHVRERLIRNISQNGRKDGMDGILLCFDEKNQSISYCAANNPPLHISDGNLLQLPGDKMPVGKGEKTNAFNTHTIKAKQGDMLYLFTDGYPDQFGGEKGKKFKYKQLEHLLLSIHNLPSPQQQQIVDAKFEEWKGNLEQVDDVCVIGVRI